MTTIGFIGLGQMGQGMAMNLLEKHRQLSVNDLDVSRTAPLTEGTNGASAIAVESPQQLAGCDIVFLCVPGAKAAETTLFGDAGLLAGASPEGGYPLVIDTTTMPTRDATRLAGLCLEKGVAYCDCPVSGLPKRAVDGTLTLMFGGSEAEFARANPFLEMMGSGPIHCGELGSGQSMKSVNNIIYNINIAAFSEVIPLALKAGLNADAVTEVVLNGSSRSFASGHFVPKVRRREFDGDFSLTAAYKDIENIRVIAESVLDNLDSGTGAASRETFFPLTEAMVGIYESAIEAGDGDAAKSSMIKRYEEVLGIEFCE